MRSANLPNFPPPFSHQFPALALLVSHLPPQMILSSSDDLYLTFVAVYSKHLLHYNQSSRRPSAVTIREKGEYECHFRNAQGVSKIGAVLQVGLENRMILLECYAHQKRCNIFDSVRTRKYCLRFWCAYHSLRTFSPPPTSLRNRTKILVQIHENSA